MVGLVLVAEELLPEERESPPARGVVEHIGHARAELAQGIGAQGGKGAEGPDLFCIVAQGEQPAINEITGDQDTDDDEPVVDRVHQEKVGPDADLLGYQVLLHGD